MAGPIARASAATLFLILLTGCQLLEQAPKPSVDVGHR